MSPIFGIRSGPIEEIAQQENDESPVVICSELRRRFNGAECMATFHANKGHDLDGMAISLLLIAECKVVEAGEPKPARSPLLEIPVFEDRTGKIHLRTREGYRWIQETVLRGTVLSVLIGCAQTAAQGNPGHFARAAAANDRDRALIVAQSVGSRSSFRQPGAAPREQRKRTIVEHAKVSWAPAISFEAAVRDATAVVVARVRSLAPVAVSNPTWPVQTDYLCTVTRTATGDDALTGQEVIVRRLGGVREEATIRRRVVVDEFPDFAAGERYVFFLHRIGDSDIFSVSAHDDQIKNDAIVAFGPSSYARAHDGADAEDFLNAVREALKR